MLRIFSGWRLINSINGSQLITHLHSFTHFTKPLTGPQELKELWFTITQRKKGNTVVFESSFYFESDCIANHWVLFRLLKNKSTSSRQMQIFKILVQIVFKLHLWISGINGQTFLIGLHDFPGSLKKFLGIINHCTSLTYLLYLHQVLG